MTSFTAELLKLRRSQGWAVVFVLPLVIVGAATFRTLSSGEPLPDGWDTLWLRTVGFHGLFPMILGVAVLASLTWRAEHRHGNWNALMTGPTSSLRIVLAKTLVVGTLAAAMQAVLLAIVVLVGKIGYGLPGMLPAQYVVVSLLVAVGGLPLAALQSGLSMLMRSFAAPVAVGLVGAGIGVVLLTARVSAAVFVLPHALATRSAQLTTGSFGDAGGPLTLGSVGTVLGAAALLTALIVGLTAVILDRRDVRAA